MLRNEINNLYIIKNKDSQGYTVGWSDVWHDDTSGQDFPLDVTFKDTKIEIISNPTNDNMTFRINGSAIRDGKPKGEELITFYPSNGEVKVPYNSKKNDTIMVQKSKWETFRSTGLVWFINQTLHLFGWALAFEYDDNNQLKDVYPARVKFRGFDEKINTEGYQKVSEYLERNIAQLKSETYE